MKNPPDFKPMSEQLRVIGLFVDRCSLSGEVFGKNRCVVLNFAPTSLAVKKV